MGGTSSVCCPQAAAQCRWLYVCHVQHLHQNADVFVSEGSKNAVAGQAVLRKSTATARAKHILPFLPHWIDCYVARLNTILFQHTLILDQDVRERVPSH
jgi:hypothetical protein